MSTCDTKETSEGSEAPTTDNSVESSACNAVVHPAKETETALKPLSDEEYASVSQQGKFDGQETLSKDGKGCLKISGIASGTASHASKSGKDYEGYLSMAAGDLLQDSKASAEQSKPEDRLVSAGAASDTGKNDKDYQLYMNTAGGNLFAANGTGTLVVNSFHSLDCDSIQSIPSQRTSDSRTSASASARSRPGAFAHGGRSTEPPVQRTSPRFQPVHLASLPRLTIRDDERSPRPGLSPSPPAHDDAGLVEAQPVTDELSPAPGCLVCARPADEKQSDTAQQRRRAGKIVFLLVLLVIVGGTALAVFTTSQKQKVVLHSQYNGTDQEMEPSEAYLMQFLPHETLQDVGNTSSPQYLAFEWLSRDPSLTDYTEARLRQRFALATFFHATGGRTIWAQNNNWLDYDVHECDWYFAGHFKIFGFEQTADSPCSGLDRLDDYQNSTDHRKDEQFYKLLWLNRNNVTGTIPRELYWLTSLESLDLAANEVHGRIDADHLQAMTDLRQLSFVWNQMTGPIPTELGYLSKLEIAYFGKNFMTGTLPTELAMLRNTLKHLTVHQNKFHGSVPSELGELSHLNILGLYNLPLLTGTIPTEFGMLSSLQYLYGYGNPQVNGTIPSELANVPGLAWLHLNGCNLWGSLPSTFAKLAPTMKELVLYDNHLTSSLPTELGLFTNMYSLVLAMNDFTGSIPSQFGQLTALQTLDVQVNHLTGTLPTELSLLTMMQDFSVAQNDLSGTIPDGYALWTAIQSFNVTDNPSLQGTIPDGLCFLQEPVTMNASLATTKTFQPKPLSYVAATPFLDFDCTTTMCGCSCQC